jgi:hypothetical protein
VTTHRLSLRDARRIAVRAQWLHRERPAGLVELVRHLTLLQLEPTAAIAPSAHLVAWSRLGSTYETAELDRALRERELVEFLGAVRPAKDVALFGAEMAAWPGPEPLVEWQRYQRDWVEANDACREDILRRLVEFGPVTTRELPDSCVVPWRSTGWTNDRNVSQLLGFMVKRGEVAIAGRRGNERLWDLAERVYPDDPIVPLQEALRRRDARRLTALGLARSRGTLSGIERLDVGQAGEEAVVEGLAGTWRVDSALLDRAFAGRAALISPFDLLVQDRKRMLELFGFDYILEMYKPAAKRRWGYYALPVVYGERLVGKLDATADRKAGALRVNAVHWDVEPGRAMVAAVDREIADLAGWLELRLETP